MKMSKKRLVVKIGSSSLTDRDGSLSPLKLAKFCDAFASVKKAGHELIVVSSGSVAAGFREIGYPSKPQTVRSKQAAAAVGQSLLMQQYRFSLQQYGITPAQMLLTRHDFRNPENYQNIFESLTELLKKGVLPIINENDSTAVDELTFGDNDMLSALLSGVVHADMLLLMTDIDGIYDDNPFQNPEAEKYEKIYSIDHDLLGRAGVSSSTVGTGGMHAKLLAAKAAQQMGTAVYISTFKETEPFQDIASYKGKGTYILPADEKQMRTSRQWIAYHASPRGSLKVDAGAAEALLHQGKSLLLVGVISVEGAFKKGDVLDVFDEHGELLGKGKAAAEARELHEHSSSSGSSPLVIHRNFWVTLNHRYTRKEDNYAE